LTDLVTELDYPQLPADARQVLRTLAYSTRSVQTRDGHWYSVRIMPYRTASNVIDGIVITFNDITSLKRLENELAAMKARAAPPGK
jgi:two-component system CheB/CheR fusion protein